MSNIYIVEYNNNIVGIYDEYKKAEYFILGGIQNKLFINNVNLRSYIINSGYNSSNKEYNSETINKETNINQPILNNQSVLLNTKNTIDYNSTEFIELSNTKIKTQHEINMLKKQKEKLDESKRVYENDLKLFNMFLETLNNDPEYIIPDIFIKKFRLMNKLNNENRLSWDNFNLEFDNSNNDYDKYFSYNQNDKKYNEIENNIFNTEEIDIETDSETEDSNIEFNNGNIELNE
jgi:hypothetical protein